VQIDAPIGNDTVKPRGELRASVLPSPAMRPHLEHGVLDDIFRVCSTADDAEGDPERSIDMAFDQGSKRSLVIQSKAIEKLFVFIQNRRQRNFFSRSSHG
jgi:hypothetical protein